ncbi:MAG: tRNA epoxyqueuosine(34) reductase QueG [Bacteroidetes bacterium CG2_30_33_31]|nr:MAG: tRNA epoxyqueuosine(34) reductase QueG [Bacteroidetes bacterium CG2_30_33_31]
MLSHQQKILLTNEIKSKAISLGFDACGISKVVPLINDGNFLQSWLDKKLNAELKYMERNTDKRINPTLILDNAKSVISVLLNYFPSNIQSEYQHYAISKYAYGVDYHFVIKEKLGKLMNFISSQTAIEINMRCFTDSAPVLDKSWAVKSGLGWIGKNSLLLNKSLGSFFFIGEIILDLELDFDNPLNAEYCGKCTACIDSCPTQAIIKPYVVDAAKCISYHTIETKKPIPDEVIEKMGSRIYGCDICQDVCPWNKKVKPHKTQEFKLSDQLSEMKKEDWENLEKPIFNQLFSLAPQKRTGFKKFKMNIEQLNPKL